jgi:hypothetical protein
MFTDPLPSNTRSIFELFGSCGNVFASRCLAMGLYVTILFKWISSFEMYTFLHRWHHERRHECYRGPDGHCLGHFCIYMKFFLNNRRKCLEVVILPWSEAALCHTALYLTISVPFPPTYLTSRFSTLLFAYHLDIQLRRSVPFEILGFRILGKQQPYSISWHYFDI